MHPTILSLWLMGGCTSPPPALRQDSAPAAADTSDRPPVDSDSILDSGGGDSGTETGWLPPEPLAPNLLLNPSFEEGTEALPAHWLSFGEGSYTWPLAGGAEGKQHLSLGGSPFALLYQRVSATPGQRYAISGQSRSDAGTGNATLKIEFHDAQERKLVEQAWSFSAPRAWSSFSLAGVAPANTATVTLSIVGAGSEPCLFDDLALREVTAALVLNLDDASHAFDGFGAQIWGYASNLGVLERGLRGLKIRYVRLENVWEQATADQLAETRALTDALGVAWVPMAWAEPGGYSAGGMLTDPAGFATWWADEVAAFDAAGQRPQAIELMNEPDSGGAWSTGISPSTYASLALATRAALDARGFSDVGIVGPGTAAFDWGGGARNYALALEAAGATAALSAWSAHAWDDDGTCGGACLERTTRDLTDATDRDPAVRPLWVTEFATKATVFGAEGASWPMPDTDGAFNATYSPGYAVRVFANALALLNAGTAVPFVWQLMDEPTEVKGKNKGWGLLDLAGNPKPAYLALETLAAALPVGGQVLRTPPQEGLALYGAAVRGEETLTVALANDSDVAVTQTLSLRGHGAGRLTLRTATAFVQTDPGDPTTRRPGAGEVQAGTVTAVGAGDWSVTLPARSTLTLLLEG